jgi:hypothetical protein
MRSSKLRKNMWKQLPVLAVLVATLLGLLIGKDLYPKPPITLEAQGPCGASNLYTSLPPKCKTLDGKLIPLPGTSPFVVVTPEGK